MKDFYALSRNVTYWTVYNFYEFALSGSHFLIKMEKNGKSDLFLCVWSNIPKAFIASY